ncbi:hypothetical protein [Roseomonas sp. HF4]|uniref:hypothetical protein n=1 Tax=Roseomonas sp. HF4 TaxID=2562313 RepID=UPI0010BFD6F4|nr:hypothetical protein [Roseomonas sp. HF4]
MNAAVTGTPSFEETKARFLGRFRHAVSTRTLPAFHDDCVALLKGNAAPTDLPYAFAYAARALLHDRASWTPDLRLGTNELDNRIGTLLEIPEAINCRDNYYHEIVAGLRHFVMGRRKAAFAQLACAARHSDFYRVVKDDFGGGASFAKTFPTTADLTAARSRLPSDLSFHSTGQGGHDMVYSVSFDPVYAAAFAENWARSVVALDHPGAALHFHVVFRTKEDEGVLARLMAAGSALPGRFWLSSETTGGNFDRAYFASARLLHGAHILRQIGAPMWIVDADAAISHPFEAALALSRSERNVTGLLHPGPSFGYLPWRAFAATWMFVPATDEAARFLSLAGDCVRYLWDERPGRNWWIDQFALKVAQLVCEDSMPSARAVSLAGKLRDPFTTSEDYKIATLSKHPDIAPLLTEGVGYGQALRQVASRY